MPVAGAGSTRPSTTGRLDIGSGRRSPGPPYRRYQRPSCEWPAANRANTLVGDWTTQFNNFLLTPAGRNLTPRFLTRCLGITSAGPATGQVHAEVGGG